MNVVSLAKQFVANARFWFVVTILGFAVPLAQAGEWIADPDTGCQVWNSDPSPGESIKWSGSCPTQKASGNGILQWYLNGNPGDKFEGQLLNGKRNGKGTSAFANGNRYEGEWKDNQMSGKGTYVWASGTRYEGEWKGGKKNGKGTNTYANGGRYEGDWKDDHKSGKGVVTYANGDRYEGEWKDDKKDGKGISSFANGNRHEGEWKDDKLNGKGTFTGTNGVRYEGVWKGGELTSTTKHELAKSEAETRCLRDAACRQDLEQRQAQCVEKIEACRKSCDTMTGTNRQSSLMGGLLASGMARTCYSACKCDSGAGELFEKFNRTTGKNN